MPDEVMTLVTLMLEGSFALRSTRGCTPTSSRVADSIPWVSQLQELGAQQHLQDVLGYPSECEMGKDPA